MDKKQQYLLPSNIVFLMGFSTPDNEKLILDIIDKDQVDHYCTVLSPIYTTEFLTGPQNTANAFKKCGVAIREYVQGLFDIYDQAKNNPDKIVLTNVCPLDIFVYLHTLDKIELISKDAHYYLCNLTSMAISPWPISNYNVILFYPDLYTILEKSKENTQLFLEQLHLMYHTYFINHISQYLKHYQIIESPSFDKREKKLQNYLNEFYNEYIAAKPDIPKFIHPVLNNECILVNEDKELQEIQKRFDEQKK